MVLSIIFWTLILLLIHSYVLFPFILKILARNKKQNEICFKEESELPLISIILAVYNEEKSIEKKIQTSLNTNYPKNKIEFLIGSDCSNDQTNNIIKKIAQTDKRIKLHEYNLRRGKPSVINDLYKEASGEILVLTDAKVFFTPNTLFQLSKHFKNSEITLVGGNLVNQSQENTGITFQEKIYMNRELLIKYHEGIIWGQMIGAFGACYAIRRSNFSPIPNNFLVDDFFVTLNILQKNKKAINELNAICYQNLTGNLHEEFKRKVRISTGNFQNLKYFRILLLKPWKSVSFCFISHKVIRWFGPFILLSILILNFILAAYNYFYITILYLNLASFFIPIIDYLLRKLKLNNRFLRFITHFYSMNIALLFGYINFLKGVKTNAWQPSQRPN